MENVKTYILGISHDYLNLVVMINKLIPSGKSSIATYPFTMYNEGYNDSHLSYVQIANRCACIIYVGVIKTAEPRSILYHLWLLSNCINHAAQLALQKAAHMLEIGPALKKKKMPGHLCRQFGFRKHDTEQNKAKCLQNYGFKEKCQQFVSSGETQHIHVTYLWKVHGKKKETTENHAYIYIFKKYPPFNVFHSFFSLK